MRSSFMIFLLGLILGSTLGIGGIWTQVVRPAGEELKKLETEHGLMQSALDEAGKALKEVASNLREESRGPAPMTTGEIFPRNGSSGIAPSGIKPGGVEAEATKLNTSDRTEIADRLDRLALKLDSAKAGKSFGR